MDLTVCFTISLVKSEEYSKPFLKGLTSIAFGLPRLSSHAAARFPIARMLLLFLSTRTIDGSRCTSALTLLIVILAYPRSRPIFAIITFSLQKI